jgi:Tfp pilus assembly protein PilO
MPRNESKFRRGSWLVTISLVAMAVIHITFVYLPGRKAVAELRREIQHRQLYLNDADEVENKLAATKQTIIEAKSFLEKWRRTSSTVNNLPLLYGHINELSKQTGAVVTRFEPQPIVELGRVREIPINMAYTGNFAQIYELIRAMERLPETIWIDYLRLDKSGESGTNILCEINIVVFSDNQNISNYAANAK